MPIQSAVILAGGGGTRMWPFADVRNKCAIPVANVPNVRRLVDALAEVGFQRVVVVLGDQPGSVRHALLGATPDVRFVDQQPGAGTAGAALTGIGALDDDRFLVVYGDTVTTAANLRAVAEAPEATGAAGAALVDTVPGVEGGNWYRADVANDRLVGVTGHDAGAETRLCGVFALNRAILPVLEANPGFMRSVPVGGMPPAEADLAQSLNDWRADIVAVCASDFVVDLDKPWHVLEANYRMANRLTSRLTENVLHPGARIDDGAEIAGFVELGANSVIGNRVVVKGNTIVGTSTNIVNGAILGGSNVIGSGCRVSDYCFVSQRTVVGNDCIVGHGAEMDGTMFDGSYLYHYCEISGLVGLSVDIGAATVCGTLRFDDGLAEHRVRGRRERPLIESNATYYGDYSRTGVNVITMPGAKIGAYACVGAGVVVYEDVPSRTLMLLKQETVQRPWGPERYGW
jgi:UDP-N-acetylglucosamine diphosphorylase / glucose-1-phosphate thymidylyltransferase / UDP-N-acetylgalactosamine diphosphorylase / glucosamine-1-phosphate N-acetyltransferase / galactosamine-1-phosphate N-acetyltransferase